MLLLALLMALLVGYFTADPHRDVDAGSSMDGVRGLYAAEAGLNIRAEQVRAGVRGLQPSRRDAPPDPALAPCAGGERRQRRLRLQSAHPLHGRNAETYVVEQPDNPTSIVVPRGEPYQNLHAQEYRYTVVSECHGHRSAAPRRSSRCSSRAG